MQSHLDPETVAYIVPFRDGDPGIGDCLKSIKKQLLGLKKEIIAVASGAIIPPFLSDDVKLICEPMPGAARARNKGLESTRARFVAFVDSDTLLSPEWTIRLHRRLQETHAGAAQGKIILESTDPSSLFGQFRRLQNIFHKEGLQNADFRLPVMNSAASYYDRSVTGPLRFNEDLIAVEDMELSWRLLDKRKVNFVYTGEAEARCRYFPESFFHFFRRNFRIGRGYSSLFEPSVREKELMLAQAWVIGELRAFFASPGLARLCRGISAIMFLIGMRYPAIRPQPVSPSSDEWRTIFYDDRIEKVQVSSGQRRSINFKGIL